MLQKIIAIKNVGRFRNSGSGGNTTLAKHTFIVGANGSGKTTICAVLRSLKTGEAAYVLGRKTLGIADGETIEILLDTGVTRFNGTAWDSNHPDIAIFDGLFVAENVHSGEAVEIDHKRNLYRVIIGDDGVRLAELDTELAGQSRAKTTEISAVVRAIQPHLPSGMTLETFVTLPVIKDIGDQIIAQETTLLALRQAASINARPVFSEFTLPGLPEGFIELLGRTIDDIAQDAERRVGEHLAAHRMDGDGSNWIAQGIDHAEGESCPFCGQNIHGLPLIAAYRAVFSARYKTLRTEINTTKDKIDKAFGEVALARLGALTEQHKGGVEFWSRYCVFDTVSLAVPGELAAAIRDIGKAALTLIQRKASAPLEAVTVDEAFIAALAAYEKAQTQTESLNQAIGLVNALVATKKAETTTPDVPGAEAKLARLKAIKTRHGDAVAALCSDHVRLCAERDAIDNHKAAIRNDLDKHTNSVVKPYEKRINDYLDAFNAGFSITETRHHYPGGVATSTYQLLINATAVPLGDGKTANNTPSFKNTLSAGDRTTLALAFFLADLERDGELANKIVVFDDPFSSQDSFRRRQTIHEIMKVAGKCRQVIVLSHDATFLKQIWDKSPLAERAALSLADYRSQGSKITPVDLERACQGRTANDMDDLQAYFVTGAGNRLDIIRKMRVVLETYLRTTYPASFAPTDWLGDMVGKIREGGTTHPAEALYDELNRITTTPKNTIMVRTLLTPHPITLTQRNWLGSRS